MWSVGVGIQPFSGPAATSRCGVNEAESASAGVEQVAAAQRARRARERSGICDAQACQIERDKANGSTAP